VVIGSGIDIVCGWLLVIDVRFSQDARRDQRVKSLGSGLVERQKVEELWGARYALGFDRYV
jgi:hypothetical protein